MQRHDLNGTMLAVQLSRHKNTISLHTIKVQHLMTMYPLP